MPLDTKESYEFHIIVPLCLTLLVIHFKLHWLLLGNAWHVNLSKTNPSAIALNPGVYQTSWQRPLKRWVSDCFQTNSGAVRLKYAKQTKDM